MKKLVFISAFAMMCLGAASAHAAVGDVAGSIYSTDIIAMINDEPIVSYNIGGRTAFIAEDLGDQYYGFTYEYHDDERTLYVRTSDAVAKRDRNVERGEVGRIVGNIYETDIKVIFNGHEVPGYNIGGRTAVVIEDLGTYDETSPNAKYGYSKYLCNFTWDNDTRTVSLYSPCDNTDGFVYAWYLYDYAVQKIKYEFDNGILTAEYDPDISRQKFTIKNDTDDMNGGAYKIKPLVYQDGNKKTEIGFWYYAPTEWNSRVNICIDRDTALPLIQALVPEKKVSYEDALERFTDSKNYETLDRIDTEDYTCILVRDKKTESDCDIRVISICKQGGYNIAMTGTSDDERNEIELSGKNEVSYISGPTADPHGRPAYITTRIELDKLSHD